MYTLKQSDNFDIYFLKIFEMSIKGSKTGYKVFQSETVATKGFISMSVISGICDGFDGMFKHYILLDK